MDEDVPWTSSILTTPLFGMDPPEVVLSSGNKQEQLATNVEGCRNALLRTLLVPDAVHNSTFTEANANNNREKSLLLELIPSPSEWIFAGRILNLEKRTCTVRTSLSSNSEIAPASISTCSTLEYVFVCQINTTPTINQTQQLLSLTDNSIDAAPHRKWVSISEIRAGLVGEKSNEFRLDKKFQAVAGQILNIQNESILKPEFSIEAHLQSEDTRRDEIIIVDDDTRATTSEQLLLGDERLVLSNVLQITIFFM